MATATKTKPVRKAPAAKAVKAAPTPKAVKPAPAPKAVKPSVPMHEFSSEWTGASDTVNARVSRTKIDASRFGSLKDAPLTERDQKALAAIKGQFGNKAFTRANIDAGIIRRLGERGYVEQVSGGEVDATATFKLTRRAA